MSTLGQHIILLLRPLHYFLAYSLLFHLYVVTLSFCFFSCFFFIFLFSDLNGGTKLKWREGCPIPGGQLLAGSILEEGAFDCIIMNMQP